MDQQVKSKMFRESLLWAIAAGGVATLISLIFGTIIGAVILAVITGVIANVLVFLGMGPSYAMFGAIVFPFLIATCVLRICFFFVMRKYPGLGSF